VLGNEFNKEHLMIIFAEVSLLEVYIGGPGVTQHLCRGTSDGYCIVLYLYQMMPEKEEQSSPVDRIRRI
jgi:hypothetical protein